MTKVARGRPRKALLSRELIISTALKQIDAGKDFSMSKIARELGVHVSSLYNHVDDREGLLEAIRSHIAQEYPVPPLAELEWEEAVQVVTVTIQTAYSAHPKLIPHLATLPVSAPEIRATYEELANILLAAGFSSYDAATAILMIDTLALGSALVRDEHATVAGSTAPSPFPDEVQVIWERNADVEQAAFRLGLDGLIAGLRARLTPSTVSHPE